MPYIKQENKILTKILGVTKANNTDSRQKILHQIKERLVTPKYFYIDGIDVHIVIDDPNGPKDIIVGNIKEEYRAVLSKSKYLINTYQVTGGYKIGQEVMINGKQRVAFYGMNISIKLFPNNVDNPSKIIV